MKHYSKRAGPQNAAFAYPVSLGEEVLELLGFVQGPSCWIRRMTDKEG